MNALLIDAGNTRIRVKEWPQSGASPSTVIHGGTALPLNILTESPTSQVLPGAEDWQRRLVAVRAEQGDPPVAVVSVIPAVTVLLKKLWPDIIVIDHHRQLPFSFLVDPLEAVGPDRLSNVAAAVGAGLTDALIVDAGTATTFDVLEDGVFVGGLIAPGMAFAARRIGELAARLDPVPFGPCPLEPGRETGAAMAAGAWHVGIGGIESVIQGLLKNRPGCSVILTGGLGHHLAAPGRVVDPDWTLRGAALLAGFNGK